MDRLLNDPCAREALKNKLGAEFDNWLSKWKSFEDAGDAAWDVGSLLAQLLSGTEEFRALTGLEDLQTLLRGAEDLAPNRFEGFSNGNLGQAAHDRFLDALVEQTGTKEDDWLMRTARGQNGVDATYIGPTETNPGFDHAELKPNSPYSLPRLGDQLERWNNPPGTTQLWLYNRAGIIGSSGINF